MNGASIRPARPDEAEALSALTLRSKAHWGYDDAFMATVREELRVPPSACSGVRLQVAERDGQLLGYYLITGEDPDAELDNLFVDPDAIGTGVGGALLRHAIGTASELGLSRLLIAADPHAEAFYAHAGARVIGQLPSASIPGRTLPAMVLDVPRS